MTVAYVSSSGFVEMFHRGFGGPDGGPRPERFKADPARLGEEKMVWAAGLVGDITLLLMMGEVTLG